MVAYADLEGFVHPVLIGLDAKISAFALADYVEGVAGVDADHFIFGRVVDAVLADELQAAVGIAAVKAKTSLGQRDAEMVGFRVLQLLHYPDLRIGSGAVSGVIAHLIGRVVAVLLDLRAIVNVKALRLYAGGADKLDLLGFIVVQGSR